MLTASSVWLTAPPVFAAVPHLIRYQGVLTDSAGQPVEDDSATLTFRLYDVGTGGIPIWEETHTGVPVIKGAFAVLLGSIDPTTNPLNPSLFEQSVWLTLVLEGETEMSPRQRITSTPLALRAEVAERIEQAAHFDPDTAGTLTEGLVAYWKLDESSGARADAVGTNTLTDNNTVTQTEGKVGTAAQFTADNNEYLSAADTAELSTGDVDFTIAAWVYLDDKTTDRMFICKHDATGTSEYWLRYNVTVNRFRFEIATHAVAIDAEALGSPITGTWYHLLAWHDATADTINIQVNNDAVDSIPTGGIAPADTTGAFAIGAQSSGEGRFMDGRIDEVGFWKRVLTDQERADLYNAGSGNTYHPAITSAGPWTQNGSDIFYTGGNVGIGTTSPQSQLHMLGQAIIRVENSDTGGAGVGFYNTNGYLGFVGYPGGPIGATLEALTGDVNVNANNDSGNVFLLTQNTNRMTVTSAGNVGIGTTSPTTTLDVNGPITAFGTGGNVPHDCRFIWAYGSTGSNVASVYCESGEIVTGGGGSCPYSSIETSAFDWAYNGWVVECTGDGTNVQAQALCCKQ